MCKLSDHDESLKTKKELTPFNLSFNQFVYHQCKKEQKIRLTAVCFFGELVRNCPPDCVAVNKSLMRVRDSAELYLS